MARITKFDSSKSTSNPSVKLRRKVGEGLSMINDFTSNDVVSTVLTSEANKLWRAKILLDRVTRHGPKNRDSKVNPNKKDLEWHKHRSDDPDAQSNFYTYRGGFDAGINQIEKEARNKRALMEVHFSKEQGTEPHNFDRAFGREDAREKGNDIIIYNLLSSPVQYLILQTVPKEIEFQNESIWAVIHSMGRNTPMYHFTGAESTIQMNISWFCNDKANPQEVVAKCRLLEAWSKANGYNAGPPILKIQWGRSDLFKDQYFILTAATYKLSNWRADAKIWDKDQKKFVRPNGYVDPALYPSTATQELIFRRVSGHNLTYEDIIPAKWLEKTSGFKKENK